MTKEPHLPVRPKPYKLGRLPKGSKIQKRPLLHPTIAPARTGSTTPKVVYVSHCSPFIATIKRVKSYLAEIEKRASNATPKIDLLDSSTDREKLDRIAAELDGGAGGRREVVAVKGTGKAIDKVMQVAIHFQGQAGVDVRVKTGSVGTVDDYEENGEEKSRVRMTSMLEVLVRLKG